MRLGYIFLALLLGSLAIVRANEDAAEGEDDGKVEEEGAEQGEAAPDAATKEGAVTASDKDVDEEVEVKPIQPSPDAETTILFTSPVNAKELPAGGVVRLLVGFLNKGDEDFFVESLDAAFHYPMDHTFYIRNFTSNPINLIVKPDREATYAYALMPAEDLAGRPYGLRVNLNYRNLNGTRYQNAVFNETVNIVEDESGFNPETGFLYVLIGCVVVLLLVLGQMMLQKMRKKAGMMKRKEAAPVEMGTANNADIDWEWIPKEVLNIASKSPKPGSPKRSPRQRKGKNKGGGRGDADSDDYE